MLDDVKAYYEAIEKAQADYDKTNEESQRARRRKGGSQTIRNAEIEAAQARQQAAVIDARLGLLRSEDPLVRFIADRPLRDYPDHARDVLQILPATVEEITELSRTKSWCGTFNEYLMAAEDAGVLPGQKPITPERVELREWFGRHWTANRQYRKQLMQYVDKIVAAELAAAGVVTEEAPAEPEAESKTD